MIMYLFIYLFKTIFKEGANLKIVFTIAYGVDPDEMPQSAAFHLGLNCLPKSTFSNFHCIKGKGRTDVYLIFKSPQRARSSCSYIFHLIGCCFTGKITCKIIDRS